MRTVKRKFPGWDGSGSLREAPNYEYCIPGLAYRRDRVHGVVPHSCHDNCGGTIVEYVECPTEEALEWLQSEANAEMDARMKERADLEAAVAKIDIWHLGEL